jgi:hypothetical protein
VIAGEAWTYGEGQFEKRVHKPGDRLYVGPGQARGMSFADEVWAVEYARGPLPLSLPFDLADVLLTTLDISTVARTLGIDAALVGRHWKLPMPDGSRASTLRQGLGGVLGSLGPALTRWTRPADPDDAIPPGSAGSASPGPGAGGRGDPEAS